MGGMQCGGYQNEGHGAMKFRRAVPTVDRHVRTLPTFTP